MPIDLESTANVLTILGNFDLLKLILVVLVFVMLMLTLKMVSDGKLVNRQLDLFERQIASQGKLAESVAEIAKDLHDISANDLKEHAALRESLAIAKSELVEANIKAAQENRERLEEVRSSLSSAIEINANRVRGSIDPITTELRRLVVAVETVQSIATTILAEIEIFKKQHKEHS